MESTFYTLPAHIIPILTHPQHICRRCSELRERIHSVPRSTPLVHTARRRRRVTIARNEHAARRPHSAVALLSRAGGVPRPLAPRDRVRRARLALPARRSSGRERHFSLTRALPRGQRPRGHATEPRANGLFTPGQPRWVGGAEPAPPDTARPQDHAGHAGVHPTSPTTPPSTRPPPRATERDSEARCLRVLRLFHGSSHPVRVSAGSFYRLRTRSSTPVSAPRSLCALTGSATLSIIFCNSSAVSTCCGKSLPMDGQLHARFINLHLCVVLSEIIYC